VKQLSLRPYNGKLFIAKSRREYEKAHEKLFNKPDILQCNQAGRFNGGEGKDGRWTYLIWAKETPQLVHELAHVVFHTFERCGIDPKNDLGEAFCYMLSQLLIDAQRSR